jgi:hypothetical protein
MVVFDAGSCSRPGTLANGVCVIEAKQSFAVLIVQRQRVIQAVRPIRRNGNLFYNELDPTRSIRVCDEALAVEQ